MTGFEIDPAVAPFDLLGELPQGTVVLQASAGTGKTFAIAGLVARYVAEGVARLDELLVVTFGRAASDELRERVRERLVSLHDGLRGVERSSAPDSAGTAPQVEAEAVDDALLRHLARGDRREVAARIDRLWRAVSAFDGATIATTHGMCEEMLHLSGLASDRDPEARFTEDGAELVAEVAADAYLSRYAFGPPDGTAPSFKQATALAAEVAGQPGVQIGPVDSPVPNAAERVRLAERLRAGLDHRRRWYHLEDFDDLLTGTAAAVTDPETGETACERIRQRYRVVLVDEFQDTDPLQWEILCRVFHGHRTLVLVGDPKQAIYGFRGGDVQTYLAATTEAAAQGGTATIGLTDNYRSDAPLVAGLEALLGGLALGETRIRVSPVQARRPGVRLTGPGSEPVQVRWFDRELLGVRGTRLPAVRGVREAVVADLVGQVALAVDGTRRWQQEPVRPSDVAVLVRTNAQGELVRDALVAAGIPAVMHSTSSVFGTPGAQEWLTLLRAVERPRDTARARAAALGVFGGWSAGRLATASEEEIEQWRGHLRRWARLLEVRGVAALLEHLMSTSGVQERVMATNGGERLLTDLRHVGQILHETAATHRWGAAALTGWLTRQVRQETTVVARPRRLDSDALAVQVVTVHRSKGLEFPVVFVPFGWDRFDKSEPAVLRYHDEGQRRLHVGGKSDPGYGLAQSVAAIEDLGEDLRLLYVALTRASGQVVTWWAPSTNTPTSAMHRVLFGERDLTGGLPSRVPVPADRQVAARLEQVAGPHVHVEAVTPSAPDRAAAAVGDSPDGRPLRAREFVRDLDTTWRRLSYSALTAAAHTSSTPATATTEPDDAPERDEPRTPSPMAGLPAGAAVGVFVHAVLEHADTTAPDLREELLTRARRTGATSWSLGSSGSTGVDLAPEQLADALLPVMRTPLGPLTTTGGVDIALADVAPRDRLSELAFEFPLAAEDTTGITVADIAALLGRWLPADDPLSAYPDLLAGAGLGEQELRGYLTGSIDSVLRVRDTGGEPRYVVVDYKTNWLGQWDGQELTAHDYRQSALARAMMDSHYPLQAVLYSAALHRFLRWRQPGYDPSVHLGGVLYLFLRGMVGPEAPVENGWRSGVFGWRPPAGLVVELSARLAGEA